jgi:hypothetical protein
MTCNAISKASDKNSKHRKKTKLPNWKLDSNEDQKKYDAETPSQGGDKNCLLEWDCTLSSSIIQRQQETQTSNLPFNSTNATIACLHCD